MVGVTPKEMARFYRFAQIVTSLDPAKPVDWGQISHQSRFYDLSHLNKDFVEFTGHSPSDYLLLRQRFEAENAPCRLIFYKSSVLQFCTVKCGFKCAGGNPMGKVFFDVSMSLDGFISGANVRPEAGLGDGGERLHEWAFKSTDPRNQEIIAIGATMGAMIVGRTTYDLSIPYWKADGPVGAARVPTVVVSHSIPQDVPDNHVYTFVNGIDAAVEAAKKLAGDKDISTTGANVPTQLLQRGLLDEISIHIVPVLFGSGTRLFGDLESKHISLEPIEVINTPEVTHLRYRVVK